MRGTVQFAAVVATLAGCAPLGAGELRLRLEPGTINMGTFYSGADVRLGGVVKPGSKVAVIVRGESRAEIFNRKVRAGPIWINSGKVKVSGVPTLFLRFSDGMLRNFLSREDLDRHQMDQAAIQHQIEIAPDQDHETMVASWLNLKAADGTYSLIRNGVVMGPAGPEGVPFTVAFRWPRKAPPAEYQVTAYECRDWKVMDSESVKLPVVRVGFPAWLTDMARNRSLWYGVLATLTAAAFGFAIDFLVALIFGKKAATAH